MKAQDTLAECLACDLTAGKQPLPGGQIHATRQWGVEHCIGPLGVGTLIVKPFRHCVSMAELTEQEARELGPLLRRIARLIKALMLPDQIYTCQWSHAGWEAGHVHFVIQPAWNADKTRHDRPGPFMQVDMFNAKVAPFAVDVEAFAQRAREAMRDSVDDTDGY
jgi:diadenosine tetraphosphate (Ap4A) HIT family hydrolase